MLAVRNSLKVRIVAISIAALAVAIALAGVLIVHNARNAVRAEINSSMDLVDRLVKVLLPHGDRKLAGGTEISQFVERLRQTRHLDITIEERNDAPRTEPSSEQAIVDIDAPAWFAGIMLPAIPELPRIYIQSDRHADETYVVRANPADEIEEIWGNVRILIAVTSGLLVLLSVLLYFIVHNGLRPLNMLTNGFKRLEQGDFSARIDDGAVRELATINRQFNHVSAVLEQAMRDKQLLARRLLYLQEDERRALARELHDDVGPCFFGIRTDTTLIRGYLEKRTLEEVPARLDSIDQIVDQLQTQIRQILQSLRPASVDGEALEAAIRELLAGWQARLPNITWTLDCTPAPSDLHIEISSTLYRIVQECLTNIAKHAEASVVTVAIDYTAGHAQLWVSDNGKGIAQGTSFGLGLIGIKERTEALGGRFEMADNTPTGVNLRVRIPLTY